MLNQLLNIIFLFLFYNPVEAKLPPEPNICVKFLISGLSNPSYQNRETATRMLISLEHNALQGCYNSIKTTVDPEIKWRSEQVIHKIYCKGGSDNAKNQFPSIYMLPDEVRYPFGVKYKTKPESYLGTELAHIHYYFDLSKYYYEKAREVIDPTFPGYSSQRIEREAMYLFVSDWIYYGKDIEKIKKIINSSAERSAKMRNSHINLTRESVPGPAIDKVEDSIPQNMEFPH